MCPDCVRMSGHWNGWCLTRVSAGAKPSARRNCLICRGRQPRGSRRPLRAFGSFVGSNPTPSADRAEYSSFAGVTEADRPADRCQGDPPETAGDRSKRVLTGAFVAHRIRRFRSLLACLIGFRLGDGRPDGDTAEPCSRPPSWPPSRTHDQTPWGPSTTHSFSSSVNSQMKRPSGKKRLALTG